MLKWKKEMKIRINKIHNRRLRRMGLAIRVGWSNNRPTMKEKKIRNLSLMKKR